MKDLPDWLQLLIKELIGQQQTTIKLGEHIRTKITSRTGQWGNKDSIIIETEHYCIYQ